MSTEAKTSAGSGKMLSGGTFFNDQFVNLSHPDMDEITKKYINNSFDDILVKTKGDVSITMRISDNMYLLEKILVMFQGLSETINSSLHQIK